MIGWWIAGGLLVLLIVLAVAYKQLKNRIAETRVETANLAGRLSDVQQELFEFKARRKKLISAATQALIIIESDYTVSSANKVARKLFGKPKGNITLMAWTRQHQLQELVTKTMADEKLPALYFNYKGRTLEAHARSIKEQKKIVAVAVAIHDITEIQQLSRARRDFVANISHELRTPLASIQLLTDTLLNGGLDDPPVALDLTKKIATQVDTLHQMAQEVLDLSMIESGKAPLKMSVCHLRPIVETQIARYLPQAERKQLFFDIQIDEDTVVLVDSTMVGRVLSNLVHNAIKFTDEGRITVAAHACHSASPLDDDQTEPDGEWVEISVTDTGVGLSPDEISRIFERFYKVDRARNRQGAGTGLGLAIARHIVEAHGGRIWAEQNGVGAKFCFTVPTE